MQDKMEENAQKASGFLKMLSNKNRLLILCSLAQGEKAASELVDISGLSQTATSNHLAAMRDADIIDYRREQRELYYYIKDSNVLRIIGVLYDIYCK